MLIRSRSVTVVRRQRVLYLALAGAVLFTAAALLGRSLLVQGSPSWNLGFGMVFVGTFLGLVCAAMAITSRAEPVAGRRAPGQEGVLEAADVDIRVEAGGRQLRIPRKKIEAGWIEQTGERPTVILQARGGTTVYAEIDDATSAEQLLREAGVAPEQRAITMGIGFPPKLGGIVLRGAEMVMLGGFGLMMLLLGISVLASEGSSVVPGLMPALVGAFCVFRAIHRYAPRSVRVGTDGILLKRLRRRFVPFRGLKTAEAHGASILLHVGDREPIDIPTSSPEEASAVVARILQAKAAGDRGSDADRLTALDRAGRSLPEWRAALASMARPGGGGYREKGVSPSELVTVVEDARAPIPRRVAAAVALASSEKELQSRVRVAIDACAEDRLRVALDKALEGEIDEELIEKAEIASRSPG
jgi:hypothetical protein